MACEGSSSCICSFMDYPYLFPFPLYAHSRALLLFTHFLCSHFFSHLFLLWRLISFCINLSFLSGLFLHILPFRFLLACALHFLVLPFLSINMRVLSWYKAIIYFLYFWKWYFCPGANCLKLFVESK